MRNGEQQTTVLVRERHWQVPVTTGRPAPQRPEQGTQHSDHGEVGTHIERIMALAEAGFLEDAREACADVMFEFQPLLLARPALLQRFTQVLRRCHAEQLQRRLAIAINGDTP